MGLRQSASVSSPSNSQIEPAQRPHDRIVAGFARGLFSAVRQMPRERALELAASLGRAYARLHGPRTRVARINLRIAFPSWSEGQRSQILEAAFANLARGIVDVAFLPQLHGSNLRELIEFEGLEHLESARARTDHGGVIGLTGHFGSWELMMAAISLLGHPVSLVYRKRENPGLESLIDEWRRAGGVETLARGNTARTALGALQRGRLLGLPLDQNAARDEGVFVPFFTRLACTRDGPARIAMRTGTPVVPIFIFRLGNGVRHRIRIFPALDLLQETPSGPERKDAIRENVLRMTRVFEGVIRERPDHWIWNHRRWKTQPRGDARTYPTRRFFRRQPSAAGSR